MVRPYVIGLPQRLITQKTNSTPLSSTMIFVWRFNQPRRHRMFENSACPDKNAVQVAGDAYVGEGMH